MDQAPELAVVTMSALPLIAVLAVFVFAACIVACYACHRAINAEIMVKALQNSTHKIQYMPVELPDDPTDPEEKVIDEKLAKHDREAMERLNLEVEPLD